MSGISKLIVTIGQKVDSKDKKSITDIHIKKSIETKFNEAFPEFSPEIVRWFRKHKHEL